jgi:hypothetical protein
LNNTSSVISKSAFVNQTARQHWSLTAERFQTGLLSPFDCVICGVTGLDPIGRNRKQEHLCDGCSDPIQLRTFMKISLHGSIHELEELQTKKGTLWLKITLEINDAGEKTLLPVSCFSGVADQARNLRIGTMVRVACRISGTAYQPPDGSRIKRSIAFTVETLTVVPREPLVPRRESNWHRKAVVPVPRNADGEPTDINF